MLTGDRERWVMVIGVTVTGTWGRNKTLLSIRWRSPRLPMSSREAASHLRSRNSLHPHEMFNPSRVSPHSERTLHDTTSDDQSYPQLSEQSSAVPAAAVVLSSPQIEF